MKIIDIIIIALIVIIIAIMFKTFFDFYDDETYSSCSKKTEPFVQSIETYESVPTQPIQGTSTSESTPFPTDVNGYIHFRNDTGKPITVWLDKELAPCKPVEIGGPALGECNWDNNNSSASYIVNANGTKNMIRLSNKSDLQPRQILGVQVPRDSTGKYYWCSDQKQKDGSLQRVCPGTGAWVTEQGIIMEAPNKVMRAEYNWNTNSNWKNISYNLSGVDGINAAMTMEYTGPECKGVALTQCNIDINTRSNDNLYGCPWEDHDSGSFSCGSVKYHCEGEDCDMAGCGYSDPDNILKCRRWWATNPQALEWKNYLQKNPSGACDMYAWAYDELIFDPSTGKTTDNPINPLRSCTLTQQGNLNISILKVKSRSQIPITPTPVPTYQDCNAVLPSPDQCPSGSQDDPVYVCYDTNKPSSQWGCSLTGPFPLQSCQTQCIKLGEPTPTPTLTPAPTPAPTPTPTLSPIPTYSNCSIVLPTSDQCPTGSRTDPVYVCYDINKPSSQWGCSLAGPFPHQDCPTQCIKTN